MHMFERDVKWISEIKAISIRLFWSVNKRSPRWFRILLAFQRSNSSELAVGELFVII
jgi:hypothetical protein